jgi:trehalose 6-phosphate synthase
LAVGVQSALADTGGLWFGWSGKIVDEPPAAPNVVQKGQITYALSDLTQEDHDHYYGGFANRTLWPLFHYRLDLASFQHEWWATYRDVNRRFAEQLIPLLRAGDTIWVQDYHLIPLGRELRRLGFDGRIGFFLHIPFPAAQILVTMPWHRQVAGDLCAYDVTGFQSETDLQQFKDYITRELDGQTGEGGTIRALGREFVGLACPIGIDVDDMARLGQSTEARRAIQRLRTNMVGRALILGVDRLDYTKGIPERLRGFEMLLSEHEEHRGRISFLQISAPSREDVPEYVQLREEVERLSGHINGRFGEADWVPLRYINRSYSRRVLAGFYRLSRVGYVTPLRDGLNLVAEEFVAAQDEEEPGVLVLSRFAGAAEHLKGALVVNPYDTYDVAGALHRALTMSREERQERHRTLFAAIRGNDIHAWRTRFLRALIPEQSEAGHATASSAVA